MPRPVNWAVWVLLAICVAGCADGVGVHDWNHAPVYVTGQVKYRGQPVRGGSIVFSADPQYGAGTEILTSELGLTGHFTLHDHHQTGLKPGYYRITISNASHSHLAIPSRYHDPATSGLHCYVEPNQPLRLTIELD
jgi:hypothetical protein